MIHFIILLSLLATNHQQHTPHKATQETTVPSSCTTTSSDCAPRAPMCGLFGC